ncbi:MAG: 30S ribosomal protein S17 [Candidatus Omnitrophota bacterium]
MGRKKELTGTVVSDKMAKTIVVKVMRKEKHPTYDRIIKTYKKFKAHDESGTAHMGDTVTIVQTRPLSKEKFFRLLTIVKKAQQTPELKEVTI